ncbi:response regulator transcription factor [Vibrio sp. 10N.261.46.E12]|uniref:helix-turn-helix transcriptional regulator n=1 Tax=unclassified Vibrio TaxID=2614977 RepID=UPI000977086E|nr:MULTISPECIES: response regulator transcription factor [unclassified Vibrio]OMO36337.1 helix-turn-helix transcriptional regulator [Vibrio sp. 10N.261.45.E1]PMM73308.1 helix-turn-helix transcriptional regulator [Vibrio sp. 10N.261.46.F12]PMM88084.1 helix-turn-helix transcriptional regulator [Vibrio sp. 10N.261.46.E8]PMN43543.1 helix-turn-helix transcriptional regulator [Vibrio sp. 10N.261.45.E11]PMN87023.1 helix-turn-helix transcriptional regulator [Vibrio sp. 10N.261.45.A6]
MSKSSKVFIASKNKGWSEVVTASLVLSFDNLCFNSADSIDTLWSLEETDIVIYDRASLGNPSVKLISPLSRNGHWLLVNANKIDMENVRGLIALGWHGALKSDITIEQLHKATRNILKGQLWFSREDMSRSLNEIVRSQVQGSVPIETLGTRYELSHKEQSIFMYLIQGYTNKQISNQLNVSLSTVKSHVSHILAKTGTQSRAQLSALLIE